VRAERFLRSSERTTCHVNFEDEMYKEALIKALLTWVCVGLLSMFALGVMDFTVIRSIVVGWGFGSLFAIAMFFECIT